MNETKWYQLQDRDGFNPVIAIPMIVAGLLIVVAILIATIDYNHGEVQRNADCSAAGGSYSEGKCDLR